MSYANELCEWVMHHTSCKWVMLHSYGPPSHMNESWHMWMSQVTYEKKMSELWSYIRMIHVTCNWVVLKCEWVTSRMKEHWSYIQVCHVTSEWVVSDENETWHIGTYMQTRGYWVWIRMSLVPREWVITHVNESHQIFMSQVACEWVTSRTNASRHTRIVAVKI